MLFSVIQFIKSPLEYTVSDTTLKRLEEELASNGL